MPLQRSLARGFCQDVLIASWIHDRDLLLRFVESTYQFQPEIVFQRKRSQSFARSLPHLSWIRPEETRSTYYLPIHHCVVLTEMMTLDPVAPRSLIRRSTEEREVILFRISALAAVVLHELQHIFHAHDRDRFDVTRLAQSRRQ